MFHVNLFIGFFILFFILSSNGLARAESIPLHLLLRGSTHQLENWKNHINQSLEDSGLIGTIDIQYQKHSIFRWQKPDGKASTIELNPKPPKVKNLYWIGSVSKQINAFVVLSVLEQFGMSLDTPVKKILYPEDSKDFLSKEGQSVTIRHLLNHTSGLTEKCPSYHQNYPLGHWLLRDCISQQNPQFQPGKHFNYFNEGYDILALIAEKVADKPFSDLRASVLEQWELYELKEKVDGFGKNSRLVPGKATLFSQSFSPFPLLMMHPHYYGGLGISGNLVSHISALHAWNEVLHRRVKYKKAAIYKAMTTPVLEKYGMGIIVEDNYFKGKRGHWYWHNGSLSPMGYSSFLAYLPEYQLSFIALSPRTHHVSALTQKSHELLKKLMVSVGDRQPFKNSSSESETAIWMVYFLLYVILWLLIRQFNQIDKSLPQITNITWNIALCLFFLKSTDFFFRREIFIGGFIVFWLFTYIVWGRYWIYGYTYSKVMIRSFFLASVALWGYIFWFDKITLLYFIGTILLILISLMPGHYQFRNRQSKI